MTFSIGPWIVWAATEAETSESVVPAWVKLLLTAGVFLIPYGLGVLIARQLKLKEYAFKISVVLFAATLGVMPFVYQYIFGALEQAHYERQLETWKMMRQESPIGPEDVEEIKEEYPTLRINAFQAENGDTPAEISASES